MASAQRNGIGLGLGWRCLFGAGLALAVLAIPTTRAAEPEANSPAERRREALEVYEAFREIWDALRAEGQGDPRSTAALPDRPAKAITPPSLAPADVDALLRRSLAGEKVAAARTTDDEAFARRVYLDVTGVPPSPDQLAAFLADDAKDKRARLIDRLLDDPEYARNWARYWRDVVKFHAAATNPAQARFDYLESWLAERFAANAPWDEIATGLITAEGRNDQNGATVFSLAQMAQPVEMAAEASRIFLGVQIQCAQCHDHPTDPWKREQFHEFAAFFAGSRARRIYDDGRRIPAFELVVPAGRPRYAMPDLEDPQKQVPVEPHFFLASAGEVVPSGLGASERRGLVASYITGQDNPWFSRAFVNRVWYALVGEGFYNPIDDMGPTREANAPEVLEALATQWQQGGYDVKWLFRTILNTKAYQRASRSTDTAAGRTPFASICPSQLRADQIVSALVQALDLPFDRGPADGRGRMMANAAQGGGAGAAMRNPRFDPRTGLNVLFGVDPSTPNDEVLGTIPQALFMMNGPAIHQALEARRGGVITEVLASTADDHRALEAVYLRVLSRRPNDRESAACLGYLDEVGDRREAFEDIYWSLINSTEFVSRR